MSILLQALESVEALRNYADVTANLQKALRSCGFPHFALLRTPRPHEDPNDLALAGSYPQGWADLYMQRRYFVIDPVVRYVNHAKGNFRWSEALATFHDDPHYRRMKRMMTEARDFGLDDGYIFPVHGPRGLAGYATAGGKPVHLTVSEATLCENLVKRTFWRLLEIRRNESYAEHLQTDARPKLTDREMESLQYLSDGMTSPEIAGLLDISNHTVDWYMNGLQQKLRARNRHHAVAIAFRMGLLS